MPTDHRAASANLVITCAVVTCSDTRTTETDTSGPLMMERLETAGHTIVGYRIVPDEREAIVAALDEYCGVADVVLFNGGTGITARDGTFEALSDILERQLPGFGEIFRVLSYDDVGPAAMLSRAIAGVYRNTLVFSTPGSSGAVRLAMDKLIVPELRHLVWETRR